MASLVLLPKENQYKFRKRTPGTAISYYATDALLRDAYLNVSLITKILVGFGVGPGDAPIHLVEYTDSKGRASTVAIDDAGLALLTA